MPRYRYRTAALFGPWRDSRDAALDDAVRAGLALADDSEPEGVSWRVRGQVEADELPRSKH